MRYYVQVPARGLKGQGKHVQGILKKVLHEQYEEHAYACYQQHACNGQHIIGLMFC